MLTTEIPKLSFRISNLQKYIRSLEGTLVFVLPLPPSVEYFVQLWGPQHEDMDLLEQFQMKTMTVIRGLEHLSYEERLGELGLVQPEEKTSGRF